ncbi:hypothetical protein DSECCO2_423710 [anaerobic digester metagenome]
MIECFASSRPPTSPQLTEGISTKISLRAEGSASISASSKFFLVTTIFSSLSGGIVSISRSRSGRFSLRHLIAASCTRARRSAPTNPCVLSARDMRYRFVFSFFSLSMAASSTSISVPVSTSNSSRAPISTSGAGSPVTDSSSFSIGMPLVWICRISYLSLVSGTPIWISLSKRPGLLSAGSIASTRLVAPITTTCPLSSIPSSRVRSWATTRLSTSPVTFSLLGAMESISSMKMTEGASWVASSKIFLSLSSLSP